MTEKTTTTRTMLVLALATTLIFALGGCAPRVAGHVARAALVTTAVVGTAAAAHAVHHAAHYHHHNCGCYRRWDGGHWVYHYQGGWEYYDRDAGVWIRHGH